MGNAGPSKPCKPERDGKKSANDSADNRSAGKDKRNISQISKRAHPKHRTTNPFLIFYLRLRSKKPNEHVTKVAQIAGKLWTRMSAEQRKKYIDLANAEKKRREERKRKKRPSASAR